jgi:hypothetical protein
LGAIASGTITNGGIDGTTGPISLASAEPRCGRSNRLMNEASGPGRAIDAPLIIQ